MMRLDYPPDKLDKAYVLMAALEIAKEAAELDGDKEKEDAVTSELRALEEKCTEFELYTGQHFDHRPGNGYPYVSTAYSRMDITRLRERKNMLALMSRLGCPYRPKK